MEPFTLDDLFGLSWESLLFADLESAPVPQPGVPQPASPTSTVQLAAGTPHSTFTGEPLSTQFVPPAHDFGVRVPLPRSIGGDQQRHVARRNQQDSAPSGTAAVPAVCGACSEAFTTPEAPPPGVVLPCTHAFCAACGDNMIDTVAESVGKLHTRASIRAALASGDLSSLSTRCPLCCAPATLAVFKQDHLARIGVLVAKRNEFQEAVAGAEVEGGAPVHDKKKCPVCQFPCSKKLQMPAVPGLEGGTENCHHITCPGCNTDLCFACMGPYPCHQGCPSYDVCVTCHTFGDSYVVTMGAPGFEPGSTIIKIVHVEDDGRTTLRRTYLSASPHVDLAPPAAAATTHGPAYTTAPQGMVTVAVKRGIVTSIRDARGLELPFRQELPFLDVRVVEEVVDANGAAPTETKPDQDAATARALSVQVTGPHAGIPVFGAPHHAGMYAPGAPYRYHAGMHAPGAPHHAGMHAPGAPHHAGVHAPGAPHHAGFAAPRFGAFYPPYGHLYMGPPPPPLPPHAVAYSQPHPHRAPHQQHPFVPPHGPDVHGYGAYRYRHGGPVRHPAPYLYHSPSTVGYTGLYHPGGYDHLGRFQQPREPDHSHYGPAFGGWPQVAGLPAPYPGGLPLPPALWPQQEPAAAHPETPLPPPQPRHAQWADVHTVAGKAVSIVTSEFSVDLHMRRSFSTLDDGDENAEDLVAFEVRAAFPPAAAPAERRAHRTGLNTGARRVGRAGLVSLAAAVARQPPRVQRQQAGTVAP